MQVINDPNRQSFGESAVNSLSSVLQGLAQNKVQQIQKANAIRELQSAFPDLDHGSLSFLASQPAKQQLEYLQNYSSGLHNLQEQQQVQQLAQQQAVQGLSEQQQQPSIPYAPGFKGPKQANYGGLEQQQRDQQIQQLQQDLVKPQPKLSLGKALGTGKGAVLNEKQQMQIEKSNKGFLDKMNEFVSSARKRKDLATQALKLVQENKVTSGLKGILPERLLTSISGDDANFVTLVGQLANEKALELRGPVGKAKIEAAQRTKASLNQPKEAQEDILKREIKEANKAEAFQTAYEEILAENNDRQPANFEQKIRARAAKIERELNKNVDRNADLPEAREYENGSVIEVDKKQYRNNSGNWVEL